MSDRPIEAIALHVTLPAAVAEVAADAIWQLGPDGIQLHDGGTFGGEQLGADQATLVVYCPPEQAERLRAQVASTLADIGVLCTLDVEAIEAQDWNAAWKAHYAPVDIGARLRVVPAWQTAPADGRVILRIDPGQAFGTGTHETTQLVATLLEDLPLQGAHVLDVGTGTALLAMAAVKLGAASAVGVDNDAEAIESAQENVAINDLQRNVTLHVAESPRALPAGQYPVVMANIISSVLLKLREPILERVAPAGTLLLSGVLTEEADAFLRRFAPAGWTVSRRVTAAEWSGFALQAPP